MDRIYKLLQKNIKEKGLPELINRYTVKQERKFLLDEEDIIKPARSYFYNDPKIWKLPAKNYFVRICIAYYISHLYNFNFYQVLDNNKILPYEDIYSVPYQEDKDTYDCIIKDIDIPQTYGYKKTIDIFGYLYNDETQFLPTKK